MKVNISDLRVNLNNYSGAPVYDSIRYEMNEALNELETRRLASNEQEAVREENKRLRNDLTRITKIKDSLIVRLREQVAFYQEERSNCDCDPLNEPQEKTPFETWFKKLHPETIESVTITLRKKEN